MKRITSDELLLLFQAYKNPEFEGFFDQLTSHVLLLDLLFKSGMYEEVIEVYKTTRERQYSFGKYAKTILVPVFGALYKLVKIICCWLDFVEVVLVIEYIICLQNSEVSYKYMLDLLQEMREASHVPIRRTICFGAALALRQNNPQLALEMLSPVTNQGFFLVRSIKVI